MDAKATMRARALDAHVHAQIDRRPLRIFPAAIDARLIRRRAGQSDMRPKPRWENMENECVPWSKFRIKLEFQLGILLFLFGYNLDDLIL